MGLECELFAVGLEVDSELLAFFVEVAALEPEGARGLRHIAVVALEFGENGGSLKILHALGERCGAGGGIGARGCRRRLQGRQCECNGIAIDFAVGEEKKPFHHVAQFADVARPPIPLQGFDG